MPKKASESFNNQENFANNYQLFCIDCRDGLQILGENSIDCIIIDTPYFTCAMGSE